MNVSAGHSLNPVSVQQNTVYPSQHLLPLEQLPQVIADIAVPGRSVYRSGATASAEPAVASRDRKLRRDVRRSSQDPAARASRSLTAPLRPRTATPARAW